MEPKALNYHAAQLMLAGNDSEAYDVLKQAISQVAAFSSSPFSSHHFPSEEVTRSVTAPLTVMPLTFPAETETHKGSTMFQWPLVALLSSDSEETTQGEDQLEDTASTTALLLFNMALACHRCANDRDRRLEMARNLYGQAHKLVSHFTTTPCTLLLTALWMNLAELALERGDLDAWHDWKDMFLEYAAPNLCQDAIPHDVAGPVNLAYLFYLTSGLQSARAA